MITYGFYDSINHDRRYNALQFGSMFDGIVRDGIFMSIGTCFRVIPGDGMMLLVGIGRGWFDHTWILNDAPYPISIPLSEVILNRIDAIVIDINQEENARKNDIILVKGTPSANPQRPALIKSKNRNQYPLAYIYVGAGVTSIRAADITSMIGTSEAPYVTGILETVNIDALLDQWKDQYLRFYENQVNDMNNTNAYWKQTWQNFYNARTSEINTMTENWANMWINWFNSQTNEIQNAYKAWEQEWNIWFDSYKDKMNATEKEWKDLWNAWFYTYINQNQQQWVDWQQDRQTEFDEWFGNLKTTVSDDMIANLADRLLRLEQCCDVVHNFMDDLLTEHTIYDSLMDSGNISSDGSSQPILDSNGDEITTKIVFVIK